MIPTPSKRPFNFPIQPDVLPFFCHPWLKPFTVPVRLPGETVIHAASGYVAIRVRRGHWFSEEYPEADPEFAERVGGLPWHRFEPDPKSLAVPKWRAMDDSRGTIYSGGVLDLWTIHGRASLNTPVLTAGGPVIPLAMLQLLARLPRCEVRMTGTPGPLLFRFTGGEGIVADYWRGKERPVPKFALFKERDTSSDLQGFKY
jgi:hypothetical protein